MGCTFLTSYHKAFSHEKRKVVYIALGGLYNCPHCKSIHKLKYEEEDENEGISKETRES